VAGQPFVALNLKSLALSPKAIYSGNAIPGVCMLTGLFRCVLVLALSASVLAQRSGGKPSLGSLGSTGPTTLPPVAPTSSASAIFVSGKVVLDDGTELTEPAVIQTICQGQRHSETYSDAHGGFSFRLGDPSQGATAAISDASSSNMSMRSGMQSAPDVRNCQLQAELAGFSSQIVELSNRVGQMNSIDVGRVPLHRLAHVDGTSISVTSALAPASAKKAFAKGLEQEKKRKWNEAEKSFEKAVQIYPRYATAWYQLGYLQLHKAFTNQSQGQMPNQDAESAKHSFEQSVAADPKYVNPYDGLAQLAMQARDWQNVIDITGKLVSLNPVNFPDAYYDNAVANYNLGNFDVAEKSALQGVRMDDAHQIPKLQYLLAMILLQKQNRQAASEHMQLFLSLAKKPDDIELAKKGLAEIEKSSASAQPRP
jgi:tetratricopeptide (TPR) repeat protein